MAIDEPTFPPHDGIRTVRTELDGTADFARRLRDQETAGEYLARTGQSLEPESILDEAKSIIENKSRDYGEPAENAARIAEFWDLYLSEKYGDETHWTLDAADVCAMMRLLKEARQIHSFGRDNLTDIAGWAAVQDEATRIQPTEAERRGGAGTKPPSWLSQEKPR